MTMTNDDDRNHLSEVTDEQLERLERKYPAASPHCRAVVEAHRRFVAAQKASVALGWPDNATDEQQRAARAVNAAGRAAFELENALDGLEQATMLWRLLSLAVAEIRGEEGKGTRFTHLVGAATAARPRPTSLTGTAINIIEQFLVTLGPRGDVTLYTPREWGKRKEQYGNAALLVVTHEACQLADVMSGAHHEVANYAKLEKLLEDAGLYMESINNWSTAIYKIDPVIIPG